MARSSTTSTTAPTPVPVLSKKDIAPVPAPAPIVEDTSKTVSKKAKKSKRETVVEEATATVAPAQPVVETPAKTLEVDPSLADSAVASVQPTENAIATKMNEFHTQLSQLTVLIQNLKNQYRSLEKSFNKELKAYYKASSKKHKRSGNRQPSGFVRPTLISEELAVFLGKSVGTEMARTEVSKEINQYIRSHNLQDKANGRNIIPDAKLTALLKLNEGDELSYFNLQKYMKHHFIKSNAVAV